MVDSSGSGTCHTIRIVAAHRDRDGLYKQFGDNMIRSFADPATEAFYTKGRSACIPSQIRRRAAMRLGQLNAATRIDDLRMPPSNRLERLKGDRAGQWSVRINDQWRLCFRFEDGDAFAVEIVDYH